MASLFQQEHEKKEVTCSVPACDAVSTDSFAQSCYGLFQIYVHSYVDALLAFHQK